MDPRTLRVRSAICPWLTATMITGTRCNLLVWMVTDEAKIQTICPYIYTVFTYLHPSKHPIVYNKNLSKAVESFPSSVGDKRVETEALLIVCLKNKLLITRAVILLMLLKPTVGFEAQVFSGGWQAICESNCQESMRGHLLHECNGLVDGGVSNVFVCVAGSLDVCYTKCQRYFCALPRMLSSFSKYHKTPEIYPYVLLSFSYTFWYESKNIIQKKQKL